MAVRQVVRYIRKPDSNRSGNKQRELAIQREITRRLNKRGIVFFNDWASGAFLTHGQNSSRASLACDKKWVDTFSPEPRHGYPGAFWELKRENVRVYLKDGVTLSKDPQIRQEAAFLELMKSKGYYTNFGIGLEDTWKDMCWYYGWEYISPETARLQF